MKTGTNHFASMGYAVLYFKAMGFTRGDVLHKIKVGEIAIGAPNVKAGESLSIIPGEGRYAIEDNKP